VDVVAALAAFDRQVRQDLAPQLPGWVTERVGQVIRTTADRSLGWGNSVQWSRLDDASARSAVEEQVRYFDGLGRCFEWKLYGYDLPPDLPEILLAAGLKAEDEETLVLGEVGDVAAASREVPLPAGIVVREATPADAAGIAALHDAVRGVERSDADEASAYGDAVVAGIMAERTADPASISILVAAAGDLLVSAGWIRFQRGADFASMWGGNTLPAWRRRGIYRHLVGLRAAQAERRGFRYLQVDCSPDSRPILERLGMHAVTTTTPYLWSASG
jgi:ribosomal protein S18 acetylase RimI-like enzyme